MVNLNEISQKKWQQDEMEYLRYDYPLKPGEKCLDIGSYRREWADEMIKRYGVQVECFDALDNKAAWIYTGKLAFGGDYLYTSIYSDKIDKEYFCVDISDYLKEEIAVCKINIEGGEYELLKYMINQDLVKNIKDLQVQFHLVDNLDCEKLYEEFHMELLKTHTLTWRYPFCWENWRRNDIYNKRFHSV